LSNLKKYWASLPLGREVTLIAQDDNGLVAFNKPAGVLSHPNRISDQPRCLLTSHYEAEGEYYEWPATTAPAKKATDTDTGAGRPSSSAKPVGPPNRLWLLNRLDSATSGVLLATSSEKLAKEIRALFLHRHVRKIYNALVFGIPSEPRQVWRDSLAVEKKGAQIRTGSGRIPCEAHMRVLAQRRTSVPTALIQLEPKTGRSHQLRVQCTKRRLPIVGDATYGDFPANREFAKASGEKRLFLHSIETSFEYTLGGKTFQFTAKAPLPAEFTVKG